MKSCSQCPARFSIVNFPGELEKTKNPNKKVETQFFGRSSTQGEYTTEGYHNQ